MKHAVKLLIYLIFALSLPNSYHLQKSENHGDKSRYRIFLRDRKISTKHIRPEIVRPYAYPSQVLLFIYKQKEVRQCGGTLISSYWVLTAAQCLEMKPDYVLIVMGDVLLTDSVTKPNTVAMFSKTFVVHDNYSVEDGFFSNNIALVKLPRFVSRNQHINIMPYSKERNERYEDYKGTALGWIQSGRDYTLRKVSSPILSNDKCVASLPSIHDGHMCLSGEEIIGICRGVSGGALLVNEVQVGVASFEHEGCTEGKPFVFTRVTYYASWIEEYTEDGSDSYRTLHRSIIISVLYYWLNDMLYIRFIF